jgi:hypothetical protein
MNRSPISFGPNANIVTFPFGVDYQKSLLLVITQDYSFASVVIPHLKVEYFENEVLMWAYNYILEYRNKYNAIPNLRILLEETKNIQGISRELYRITLEGVQEADVSSIEWLKDQTLEFIKRNIFHRAFQESVELWNTSKMNEVYDHMSKAMDSISKTSWETEDRQWFFESFQQRTMERLSFDPLMDSTSTGIVLLDKVLDGGLSLGEVGLWIGYSKRGKTTLLVNHGVQAVRRSLKTVLHIPLEGSGSLVANRYDAIFANENYGLVKRGQFNADVYKALCSEYQMLQKRLVIRSFTERWDYNIEDIHREINDLKRLHNWIPSLVIIDYGDLLSARGKFNSEEAKQRAAYQDIKSLANRGYSIWTASQPQRPKGDIETDAGLLSFKNIADCQAKIQKVDFIGSINQTKEERDAKQARLYAELYRDNEAGIVIPVYADFRTMTIRDLRGKPINTEKIVTNYQHGIQQVRAPIQ